MRFSGLVLSAGFLVAAAAAFAPAPAHAARFCAQYDDGREECAYPTYRSCMETLRGVYAGRCFEGTSSYRDDDGYAPRRASSRGRTVGQGPVNCTRYLGHGKWTDCR